MTRTEKIIALLTELPGVPHRTLARMLVAENPKLWGTVERARALIRKVVHPRREHRLPRSDHGTWTPITVSGPTLILSDLHIPFQDNRALRAAIKVARHCTTVVLNGDIVDFHHGSRFERDPSKRDMVSEVDKLAKFLLWLRERFPRAEILYKNGNHENRWDKEIWARAGYLWKLTQVRLPEVITHMTGDLGVKFVGDSPVIVNSVTVLHGHELHGKKGIERVTSPTLIGHQHQTQNFVHKGIWSSVPSWVTGCLCDLTPEWCRVNKWNHGFAVVDDHVRNYTIEDGRCHAANVPLAR